MRLATAVAALALVGVACRESVTEPSHLSRTVAGDAPSGVPVASTRGPWDHGATPYAASVTAVGDSLVLTYVSPSWCPAPSEASAGIVRDTLVVTNVGRMPADVAGCIAIAYRGGAPFRLALRPPARGRLTVVLRERLQHTAPARDFSELDVLRRTVTLR